LSVVWQEDDRPDEDDHGEQDQHAQNFANELRGSPHRTAYG
jgi:hypothetical protein